MEYGGSGGRVLPVEKKWGTPSPRVPAPLQPPLFWLSCVQVVHRSDSASTTHVCTHCGKSFKTRQRLRAHEFRHTGARPHSCRACGGAFPDRGGLAKHVKSVHAARARFACPRCGKTANRVDNLRVHMRTHADPRLLGLAADELAVSDEPLFDRVGVSARAPTLSKIGSGLAVSDEPIFDRVGVSAGSARGPTSSTIGSGLIVSEEPVFDRVGVSAGSARAPTLSKIGLTVDPLSETVSAPQLSVGIENLVPAEPLSAFCILQKRSEFVESQHPLPRYSAAVGAAGMVTRSGAVDLFHDNSAYVQHCLSFVALPAAAAAAADCLPQTEVMTANPPSSSFSYIQQQP